MKNKIMNAIAKIFDGEKLYNSRGELYSLKLETMWGELRYIVINQLDNKVDFSVDIYSYWGLLKTRTFTKKNSIEHIAQEIGQYVTGEERIWNILHQIHKK